MDRHGADAGVLDHDPRVGLGLAQKGFDHHLLHSPIFGHDLVLVVLHPLRQGRGQESLRRLLGINYCDKFLLRIIKEVASNQASNGQRQEFDTGDE